MTSKIRTELRHLLVQALTELILWIVPKDACGDAILKHILAMSKDVIKIMELEDERNRHTRPNPHN